MKKGAPIAMGYNQGPGQYILCDRAQDNTQDCRGSREAVFLHDIADHPEDQRDEHIVRAVVKGKGAQKAEGEDNREEH